MTRTGTCLFWIAAAFFCIGHSGAQTGTTGTDSGFVELSMEELQDAKAYYRLELDALIGEKKALIEKGIEDGERLLPGADIQVVPEICIRLADLYYHQEKDAYLDRMKAYEDSLAQPGGTSRTEPRQVFPKALGYYQKIIDGFPACDLVDDALYYKAFLLEETGEHREANAIYRRVAESFPESNYLPEVYMRLGEYHFNPPENNLEQAIGFYEKAAGYRESPRYPEALYKLGWSYYRLNRFAESISYFTALVEQSGPGEKPSQTGTDLKNEAVEYMAVAFADYGGPAKANDYLVKIGRPEWGRDVLRKMGDLYRIQKEEYATAVTAYGLLFDYAPLYREAPQVQKYVADCYRDMGDEGKAFEARQKIFLQYRVGSTWWNQNRDEKDRLQAYKLQEQALRDNVSALVRKAELQKNEALYREAADMAQSYLQAFPEDINALLIRWNRALILDSKLHRYGDALQEYLTISMVYDTDAYRTFMRGKGLTTLQDAALNAIIAADTLVQREYKQAGRKPGPHEAAAGETDAAPLTDTEKWLIMAYDNFIKQFPFEARTPVVLANAGALYYTHNQFNEALKYFRTLTINFPKSEQVKNVQLYILESYFGKGDFESAEALSKKLLSEGLEDRDKKAVQKRLAEAIFMRGKAFSDRNEPRQAAAEFLRMALEVPTAEFADRAVFNAGQEFEKAQDYASAVRAYELLRASYGGSDLMPDGLNNLAVNYAAMGDSLSAAVRYEELSRISKDSTEAEAALTNAFAYFNHSKSWGRAADTGERFQALFPRSSNGPMVWFKTAEACVQLKDFLRGARKYRGLAARFSQSPLGVEAYFRAGMLFLDTDSLQSAENAFTQAFVFNETLAKKGMPGNAFFASEGLYRSNLILEKRYEAVSLVLPEQVFARNLDGKQKMLRQLAENYSKVAAFQTHRMPEALFRIGRVNEQFAVTWAAQELPKLEPTAKAVKRKEINERTIRLHRQAFSAYLAAAGAMSRRVQNADASDNAAQPDSFAVTMELWMGKTKAKACEQLFRTAEINARTLQEMLDAPVPSELGEMGKLEYKSQVLTRAVLPLALATAEEHKRNLILSDSLGSSDGWADSSRVRILASTGFLPAEYEKLAFSALDGFRKRMVRYHHDARKETAAPAPETTNDMMNFLDLVKTYAGLSLKFRKAELVQAFQLGLLLPGIQAEERATIRFALGMDDSLASMKRLAVEDREWAGLLFEADNDPRMEEWLAVFEDHVFFIGECQKSVLEQAHAVLAELPEPSPQKDRAAVRLVRSAPDAYSAKLNMPLETVILMPDSTWLWSGREHPGWEKPGFRAAGWLPFSGTIDGDPVLIQKASSASGAGPSLDGDSTQASPRSEPRLFIRKTFALDGIPVSVDAEMPDSTFRCYVNGFLMPAEVKQEHLLGALRQGENSVAFLCPDFHKARFMVRIIPRRLIPMGE